MKLLFSLILPSFLQLWSLKHYLWLKVKSSQFLNSSINSLWVMKWWPDFSGLTVQCSWKASGDISLISLLTLNIYQTFLNLVVYPCWCSQNWHGAHVPTTPEVPTASQHNAGAGRQTWWNLELEITGHLTIRLDTWFMVSMVSWHCDNGMKYSLII